MLTCVECSFTEALDGSLTFSDDVFPVQLQLCDSVIELAQTALNDAHTEMRCLRSRLSCWAMAAEQRLAVFGVTVDVASQSGGSGFTRCIYAADTAAAAAAVADAGGRCLCPRELPCCVCYNSALSMN